MSEIQTSSNQWSQKGITKSKKLSTRVDLTPMVDLGFLLITFFIFTTSMSQPTAMKLTMPDDRDVVDSTKAPANLTLKLFLGKDHNIYYYKGAFDGNLQSTNFNKNEIRAVIQDKVKDVQNRYGDKKKAIVLIKVTNEAMYSDIVDALDEMLITGVDKYMLLDASPDELSAIGNFN